MSDASPALVKALNKIPNMREEEEPPCIGEDIYKALREMKGLEEEDQERRTRSWKQWRVRASSPTLQRRCSSAFQISYYPEYCSAFRSSQHLFTRISSPYVLRKSYAKLDLTVNSAPFARYSVATNNVVGLTWEISSGRALSLSFSMWFLLPWDVYVMKQEEK